MPFWFPFLATGGWVAALTWVSENSRETGQGKIEKRAEKSEKGLKQP
jgi:hypothetical protein